MVRHENTQRVENVETFQRQQVLPKNICGNLITINFRTPQLYITP